MLIIALEKVDIKLLIKVSVLLALYQAKHEAHEHNMMILEC